MTISINVRNTLALDRTRGLSPHLRRVAQRTLRETGCRGRDLSVLVTDDLEMRALNSQWRRIDRTTDVLSFEGEGDLLGDVAISLDKTERQATRYGVTLEEEIARLLVHAILHLQGHDHDTPAKRRAMNALTEDLLAVALAS